MENRKRLPNQKQIKGIIKQPCDEENLYSKINLQAIENAMLHLKGEHFKLWMYFAKNAPDYTFNLFSTHVINSCNISRDTYNKGIQELIDKGYLVDVGENNYLFKEFPYEG